MCGSLHFRIVIAPRMQNLSILAEASNRLNRASANRAKFTGTIVASRLCCELAGARFSFGTIDEGQLPARRYRFMFPVNSGQSECSNGLANVWPRSGRNALFSVEANQYEKRRPASARVAIRHCSGDRAACDRSHHAPPCARRFLRSAFIQRFFAPCCSGSTPASTYVRIDPSRDWRCPLHVYRIQPGCGSRRRDGP